MGKLDVIQWTTKSLPNGNDRPPVNSCFGLYPKLYTDNKFIYKGVMVGDDLEKPEICVIKARRYKPGTERYWQGEVDLNRYSREMAVAFTDQTLAAKIDLVDQYLAPLHGFTKWDKVCLKMKPKYFRRLLKFEIALIENAVRNLQIFSDDTVLEAFSHYSFAESNEQNLLHSFRGSKTDDGKYRLLTPEMFTHKYDIHVWFKNHTCNNICGHLSRPVEHVESSQPDKAAESGTDALYYNFDSHMEFKPMNNNENYSHEAPKDIPDKQVNFETTFGGKSSDGTYSVVTAMIHTECEGKNETTPVKNNDCFLPEKQSSEHENNDEKCTLNDQPKEKSEEDTKPTLPYVEPIIMMETDRPVEAHRCDLNESDIENKCLHNALLAKSENNFEQQTNDEVDSNIYYTQSSNTDTSTLVVRPNPFVLDIDENNEKLEYINEYGTFLQKRDKSEKNTVEDDSETKDPVDEDEINCDKVYQEKTTPMKVVEIDVCESVNHDDKRFAENVKEFNSSEENIALEDMIFNTNNDDNIAEITETESSEVEHVPNVIVESRKELSVLNNETNIEFTNNESKISKLECENQCDENVEVGECDDKDNETSHVLSDMQDNVPLPESLSGISKDNDTMEEVTVAREDIPNMNHNNVQTEMNPENSESKPCLEQNYVLSLCYDVETERNNPNASVNNVNLDSIPQHQDESIQTEKDEYKTLDNEQEVCIQPKATYCFEKEDRTSFEHFGENQQNQVSEIIPCKDTTGEAIGKESDAQDLCLKQPKMNAHSRNDEIDGGTDASENSTKLANSEFLVKYNLHSFVDTNEPNHDTTDRIEPVNVTPHSDHDENKLHEWDPSQKPLHSSLRSGKRKCPRMNVKFADDINNETRDCQEIENQLFEKSPNLSVVSMPIQMQENFMLLQHMPANINLKDPNWYSNIPCECCDNENITGRD